MTFTPPVWEVEEKAVVKAGMSPSGCGQVTPDRFRSAGKTAISCYFRCFPTSKR